LFDFDDVGVVDRAIEPVMWFWRWVRKSFGLGQYLLLHDPKILSNWVHAIQTARTPSDKKRAMPMELIPEWLSGTGLRVNDTGDFLVDGSSVGPEFVGLEFVIPQVEFLEVLSNFGPDITDIPKGMATLMLDRMNPMLKVPLELAINQNLFTKRQIRQAEQEGLGALISPELQHVLLSNRTTSTVYKAAMYGPGNELLKAFMPVRAMAAKVKSASYESLKKLRADETSLRKQMKMAEARGDEEMVRRLDDALFEVEEKQKVVTDTLNQMKALDEAASRFEQVDDSATQKKASP
jgi:major membrane immunogen (membrane-anchored lipoprotein)